MKTTNYARGRAFEYRCRDELRGKGYIVIRAAQSKGPADLVALKDAHYQFADTSQAFVSRALLVQCKMGAAAVTPKEWNALYRAAEAAGAIPVLAVAGGGGAAKSWWRLTGLKDGRGGKQPKESFEP